MTTDVHEPSGAPEPVLPAGQDHPSGHGYGPRKDEYLKRLRRVEGQVRGISRMVDEDQYCIDVLTQVAAATKALHAVSLGLLEDHLGHCVAEAARESGETGDDALVRAKVAEATAAIARLVR
ncbi:metal-sensitive transcriptional regulator [Citricoccus sp. SGAir0253]|uniref:metal-sensitive transcriptional regulator n=1 Tax=Citricoccus sp. SGAir0253 TaxID=2567881 RepID=UPI0010CCBE78|nr:metal-sensitive transcriptional regulator [Citricoccus sp. SGAir0253]QCU79074.1 metal-sensitive transcriptional regulator [Citricoccus sp. SGAir0253]